mgnify:FL=1|jgi:hypothetical protein
MCIHIKNSADYKERPDVQIVSMISLNHRLRVADLFRIS